MTSKGMPRLPTMSLVEVLPQGGPKYPTKIFPSKQGYRPSLAREVPSVLASFSIFVKFLDEFLKPRHLLRSENGSYARSPLLAHFVHLRGHLLMNRFHLLLDIGQNHVELLPLIVS